MAILPNKPKMNPLTHTEIRRKRKEEIRKRWWGRKIRR